MDLDKFSNNWVRVISGLSTRPNKIHVIKYTVYLSNNGLDVTMGRPEPVGNARTDWTLH